MHLVALLLIYLVELYLVELYLQFGDIVSGGTARVLMMVTIHANARI